MEAKHNIKENEVKEILRNRRTKYEFWDKHSLADYEDKLQEIEVEVNLQDEEAEAIALDKGVAE